MAGPSNVGLVTGAHGLVGSYVARHLRDEPDWAVMSTSRRPGPAVGGVDHVRADLGDRAQLRTAGLRDDVTHVFFAAYQMVADRAEEARVNAAILKNTVQTLLERGAPVRHITVYHGGKAYGAHVGRFKTPASESDPRLLFPLFYYDQEDALRRWSAERGIRFAIFPPGPHLRRRLRALRQHRPHRGALRHDQQGDGPAAPIPRHGPGLPLAGPVHRRPAAGQGIVVGGQRPGRSNQMFNISNGDFVRWVDT